MKTVIALLLLSLVTTLLFAQNTQPMYPGGAAAFTKYIDTKINYPEHATANAIIGNSRMRFIVNANGFIDPTSVKCILGLHPLCDSAAVQVIRSCKVKWKPGMAGNKPIAVAVTQLVEFQRKAERLEKFSMKKPVHTVVLPKSVKTKDAAWSIYFDRLMNEKILFSSVAPGDTVTVLGWAPRSFYIRHKTTNGYISWQSLQINPSLDSIARLIETQSDTVEQEEKTLYESHIVKENPKAFFSVSASKQNMHEGECITLNMEFNVFDTNKVPIQFHDLAGQTVGFIQILDNEKHHLGRSLIVNVEGKSKVVDQKPVTSYLIYQSDFCVSTRGPVIIPPLTLQMALVNPYTKAIIKALDFSSKEIKINVTPLPNGISIPAYNVTKLSGSFTVKDTILSEAVVTHRPVPYRVTISGNSNVSHLYPDLQISNVNAKLDGVLEYDTTINNVRRTVKVLDYTLLFSSPGTYDLKDKIRFSYYHPASQKVKHTGTKTVVKVLNSKEETKGELKDYNTYIVLDISQSMMIEDYQPYRLKAATSAIQSFLAQRSKCDVGLILFGGNAFVWHPELTCIDAIALDSVNSSLARNGTALGIATHLALRAFPKSDAQKKIILIGDGDNTYGGFIPGSFSQIAKYNHVKIYAVGIGNAGIVPYGRDENDEPYMIENTFSDLDFKKITSATHGEYFWAKDSDDLKRILMKIMNNTP